MRDIFFKKPLDRKSGSDVVPRSKPQNSQSFFQFLQDGGRYDLSAYMALYYYNSCAPLGSAINKIADGVASLKLRLRNKKTNEPVPFHPVLDLLNKPNAFESKSQFIKSLVAIYLATGEGFFMTTGQKKREPLELLKIYPQQVTIIQNTQDGFPDNYQFNAFSKNIKFYRDETLYKSRVAFINSDGNIEIDHYKNFNYKADSARGGTTLNQIYYEIEQYLVSSQHNYNLLRRGGRPSAVIMFGTHPNSIEEPLTEEQQAALKVELNNFYYGVDNVGKALVLPGQKVDFKETIVNNKDMDYYALKTDVRDMIYTHFNIPLPLVTPSKQSYSNMTEAQVHFYDNAIFPAAQVIIDEMNDMLIPRYKGAENYELYYDEMDVRAFRERKITELAKKVNLGILSINELRQEISYSEREDGDAIMQFGNNISSVTDPGTTQKAEGQNE